MTEQLKQWQQTIRRSGISFPARSEVQQLRPFYVVLDAFSPLRSSGARTRPGPAVEN